MLDDVARDWTLDDLAETARTSRASLVRAFRAATGLAPLAFLTDLRMGMARQQIGQGATPLAQIAANVGYQSESALSRAMLRHFGMRPSDFRRLSEETI
jgi:AraC family transcriptional regulator, activator of mtrCDE